MRSKHEFARYLSALRRRKPSKLATREHDGLRLHSGSISLIDLVKVRERMTASSRLHFDDTLRLLDVPGDQKPPPPSHLTTSDADKLVGDGIAVAVDDGELVQYQR